MPREPGVSLHEHLRTLTHQTCIFSLQVTDCRVVSTADGYFLKCSLCKECWGLDLIYVDRFDDTLAFPDGFFDYVTMLAVLELQ